MGYGKSFGLRMVGTALAFLAASLSVPAQAAAVSTAVAPRQMSAVPSRVAGDWRQSPVVPVPGSAPSASRPDKGFAEAAPDARLERVLLLLSPSAEQIKALNTTLEKLQDPASPLYHQWFSAEKYAAAFANSAADVAALCDWLKSYGLETAPVPSGRGWIEFSGSVAQVQAAFHTRVVTQTTSGGTRFALAGGLHAPAMLAPLVSGIGSLDGVLAEPALTSVVPVDAETAKAEVAAAGRTPDAADAVLHLSAAQGAGVTGTGQTVAIVGRSNVNPADVAAFRAAHGLGLPRLQVAPAGADPGLTADQAEATLAAAEIALAAPDAQILLVPAATTSATDGVDLSLAAAIDGRLAPVVVVGYSACEQELSEGRRALYAALYQQAAAEGISVIAAAGDSGASACRTSDEAALVSSGYGVNALASTPWNTAVGMAAVDSSGTGAKAGALSAWRVEEANAAYAGGGGSSAYFASPAWQPVSAEVEKQLATGTVHNRLLPDVAMPTAVSGAAETSETFCFSGLNAANGCMAVRGGGSAAAAARFAGVAALIDQKYGAQGDLAPHLYALSRQPGIFTDVDRGSAQLKCAAGSADCGSDGLIGYTALAGYDMATGLGVADVNELIKHWTIRPEVGTASALVQLSVSPTELNNTYNPTATITFTATVLSGNGGPTPTGTVNLVDSSEIQPIGPTVTLDSTGTASITLEGVFGTGGNEIFAAYSGDSTYASATSSPDVNVNIQPSTTSVAVVPSITSGTPGQTVTVVATVSVVSPPEGSVPPGGYVTLDVDGLPGNSVALSTSGGVTSATFTITIPSSGATHAIQAIYAGNANYSASTSPAVTITVTKAATTTTVTPATLAPSAGSSLVVNATVAATTSGSSTPTGTVTFLLDNVSQSVVPVATTSGTTGASYTIPSVPAGTHALTATYSGDSNFAASTSAAVTITAAKSATTTTLTATPGVLAAGTTETLTATVAPAVTVTGTTYNITGTVAFYDNGTTLLGSATLSMGSASITGVPLANNVSHSITAIYSGDPSWLTSTSSALLLVATTVPDTVVLTSNYNAANPGQALILTATVTPNTLPPLTSEQNPTGNVIFYNGTTVLGTVALSASTGDSSVATFTTSTLPGGQDNLSAYYEGDNYFDAETSNILTLDILDFTITASPSNPATNLNIVQGTSGSASFLISGEGGFSGTVQVVCAVATQDDMTCTTSPQDVPPGTTVTFVIQTYLPGQQTSTTVSRSRPIPPLWPRVVSGTALAILGVFLLPTRRRTRILADRSRQSLWMLFLLLVGLGVSGLGCSNVTGANGTGTPLGVTTIKITASANVDNTVVSHSTYLSVNVVPATSTQ